MGPRGWIGFLFFAIWIAAVYLRTRARRRSGVVHDWGHPFLDGVLLLSAGLLVAFLLAGSMFLPGLDRSHPIGRVFAYGLLFTAGGLLTWLCNALLRRTKK